MELYNKYRPTKLKEVVGNVETIKIITGMIAAKSFPHAMLMLGPSGNGKTTVARVIAQRHLNAVGRDYIEINGADFNGVATIRNIRDEMMLATQGDARVYMFDEAHKLTNDAQQILLKMLEEPPEFVYFILATTDPGKLLPTVRNRCTDLTMRALTVSEMRGLLEDVAAKEQVAFDKEVIDRIINVAEGSARRALVLLEKVIDLETVDEQLDVIQRSDLKCNAIEIVRLLSKKTTTWGEMCKVINGVEEEPESLRHLVLACAMNNLLKATNKGDDRAYLIIQAFRDHWYDFGRSSKAGLVAACYEVITTPYK